MLKVSHRVMIFLSGLVWLAIGVFLFVLGTSFLLQSKETLNTSSTELLLASLLIGAILLGTLKGRFVLGRSAKRQVRRLMALKAPIPLQKIYTLPYYLLLLSMMGLGMLMRFLPITLLVRGTIDVAIGAALLNGAFVYFRHINTRIEQL